MNIDIETGYIYFTDYPFKPASVHQTGKLHYSEITEIYPTFSPPEIITTKGELLFGFHDQIKELKLFAKHYQIPLVERLDVWSLILEPLLDADLTTEDHERLFILLSENNIPRSECIEIREKVKLPMMTYNTFTSIWNPWYRGLFDLFCALHYELAIKPEWLIHDGFDPFYFYAIEIALRAKKQTIDPKDYNKP